MELVALSAPWILLLLVIVSIGLLEYRRWKMAVVLLLLAVCESWYFEVMTVGVISRVSSSEIQDPSCELKVLSFNCNLSPRLHDVAERRAGVIKLIKEQDADVVFLTENFQPYHKDSLWIGINDIYPYSAKGNNPVGNRLYSKYPILQDTILKDNVMAYGITCCRIDITGRQVDVIGVHLSSNNYNEQMTYMTPDSVATRHQAKTYLKNIVTAGKYRESEVRNLNGNLNLNPSIRELQGKLNSGQALPTIVMGDFNDVAGSPTLNALCKGTRGSKGSMGFKDAWWEGGCGYGATIHRPLPFRIDHILYSDGLELHSIKKIGTQDLSDHDALVASIEIE